MNFFHAIVSFFIGITSLFSAHNAPIVASVTPASADATTSIVTVYVPQDATPAKIAEVTEEVQSVEPATTVAVSRSLPIISQAEIDAVMNASTSIPQTPSDMNNFSTSSGVVTGQTSQDTNVVSQPIVIFVPVPTPQNTEPLSNQNNIGNIMPQTSQAAITVEKQYDDTIDAANGIPFGQYTFIVRVLDASGAPTCGTFCDNPRDPDAVKIPVTMAIDGATPSPTDPNFNKFVNSKGPNGDYYVTFAYVPTTEGEHSIVFSSPTLESLTQTIDTDTDGSSD